MHKQDLITVRPYQTGDESFIYATMLRGLYYGDTWFSRIPKHVFMTEYHKIISAIITSDRNLIQVSCLKDDPDVILGYSILSADGTKIHWVFVKKAWRNIGIAKSLVPNTIKVATHLTNEGASLLSKRPEIVFNPFAL